MKSEEVWPHRFNVLRPLGPNNHLFLFRFLGKLSTFSYCTQYLMYYSYPFVNGDCMIFGLLIFPTTTIVHSHPVVNLVELSCVWHILQQPSSEILKFLSFSLLSFIHGVFSDLAWRIPLSILEITLLHVVDLVDDNNIFITSITLVSKATPKFWLKY